MTIPSFEDVDKILLDQNLNARFIYNNIQVQYNFTEAFSELDVEPKFPFKMKLTGHYFINKQSSESKTIEIKVILFLFKSQISGCERYGILTVRRNMSTLPSAICF